MKISLDFVKKFVIEDYAYNEFEMYNYSRMFKKNYSTLPDSIAVRIDIPVDDNRTRSDIFKYISDEIEKIDSTAMQWPLYYTSYHNYPVILFNAKYANAFLDGLRNASQIYNELEIDEESYHATVKKLNENDYLTSAPAP